MIAEPSTRDNAPTIPQMAAMDFELWQREPSADNWANLATPYVQLLRISYGLMTCSKSHLVGFARAMNKDETLERLMKDKIDRKAWLTAMSEMIGGAHARLLIAASAMVAEDDPEGTAAEGGQ
jgi:hypothetical protein